MIKCAWHCCTTYFEPGKRTKFCSPKCKGKYFVDKRRKELKLLAVKYKGGKCEKCDYSKCLRALEFHHEDGTKEFGISRGGHTRSWEKLKKELDKCVLLCSNCHAEEHDRLLNCQVA